MDEPNVDEPNVVFEVLKYWGAQDVESTLSCFTDDVVYRLHMDTTGMPFGQDAVGRDAFRDRMFDYLAAFDYVLYEPAILEVTPEKARVRIHFGFRHRASGEIISGYNRFILSIRDNRICKLDEYFDAPMFEAFMRLAGGQVAETEK